MQMFAKFPAGFNKLCVGNMFFWYSMFLFMPVLPIYYHSLGMGKDEIGLAVGSLSLGSFALRFLSGRAVDKYGAKIVIRIGFCVSAVVILGYLFADSIYSTIFVRFLHGAGLSGYAAAVLVGATSMVSADMSMSAISLLTLFSQIGIGLATCMALWLYGTGGFSLIVGLGVAVTALVLFFFPDIPHTASRGEDVGQDTAVSSLARDKYIFIPTLSIFFTHSSYSAIMTFLPVYLVSERLSGAPYFYAAYAISIIVARFFVTGVCERIAAHKMVLYVILAFALEIFIIATFHQVFALVLAGILLGIAFGFAFPVLANIVNSHTDVSVRGAAFGFFNTGNDIGQMFGSVALGFMVEWSGYANAFFFFGFLLLCYAIIYTRFFMKHVA